MGSAATVRSAVALTGDAVAAYNSMKAVRSDPAALSREIAKRSPDVVLRVLQYDGGRVLPIGGYFIGAGINALDPKVWKGAALFKLRIEIRDLYESNLIDVGEYEELVRSLGTRPAYVNKMIIVHKLRAAGGE